MAASVAWVQASVYDGTEDSVLKFSQGTGSAYRLKALPFDTSRPAIVSFWARAESSMRVRVEALGEPHGVDIGMEWGRVELKIDAPEGQDVYICPMADADLYLYKAMVESGATRPSDWTAAPEDAEEEMTGLDTRITRAESDIEMTQGMIALRVVEEVEQAVDGFETRMRQNESEILAAKDAISLRVTQEQMSHAILGLDIGGRNLLCGTRMLEADGVYFARATATSVAMDAEGFGNLTIRASGDWNNVDFYIPDIPVADLEGREAVFSFWAKSSGLKSVPKSYRMVLGVFDDAHARIRRTTWELDDAEFNCNQYLDGEWVRVVWRGTLPTAQEMGQVGSGTYTMYGIQLFSVASNTAHDLIVKKPKLEFGTVPTDWTPSPDDLEKGMETEREKLESAIELTREQVELRVLADELEMSMRVRPDGVHIGRAGDFYEARINGESFDILAGGETVAAFRDGLMIVGGWAIRATSDGGLAQSRYEE